MNSISDKEKRDKLRLTLKQIHLRAQVRAGRTLTHDDLADLAGVGKRSVGDWMRGVSAPAGMSAIFELLSQLDDNDVIEVLRDWRTAATIAEKNTDPISGARQRRGDKAEHIRKRPSKKQGQ